VEVRRSAEQHSRPLTEFESNGVVSFLARGDALVVRMDLPAGGRIGLHPAAADQVLIVVDGSGTVTGEGEAVDVSAGDVVRWAAGEEHETSTNAGLVAVVVEAAALELG
jgi:quercetin dioxygenase-like cupin family protein